MSKTYIILTIVLIGFALGLVLLPESNKSKDVKPEILLKAIHGNSRYLSPDLIAERLINEDPSIFLIDVRTPKQFKEYSLPNSFNIPLDQITQDNWIDYLDQANMDVVLISNGGLFADQAWILCTRIGYKNLYVMDGGLNSWFKDIMQPMQPSETSAIEEFELYSFRLAASQYFGGGSNVDVQSDLPKENIVIKKRVKKSAAAGGC